MEHTRDGCGGFTLIELLVTLAVLTLLQTLAVPALSSVLDSVRLGRASESFFLALHFTRSEAVKRNARVVLCKSAAGASCSKSGGWEQGWIVFQDANNNAQLDAGEAILLHEPALPASIRASGNAQVESYVSYTPLGQPRSTSGAFQAGTLTLCRQLATRTAARQVVISGAGRVRSVRTTVDSCA